MFFIKVFWGSEFFLRIFVRMMVWEVLGGMALVFLSIRGDLGILVVGIAFFGGSEFFCEGESRVFFVCIIDKFVV